MNSIQGIDKSTFIDTLSTEKEEGETKIAHDTAEIDEFATLLAEMDDTTLLVKKYFDSKKKKFESDSKGIEDGSLTFSTFVKSNYAVYSSNCSRIEDAEIIFLAESHLSHEERDTNAMCIDLFANEESCIMVESEPSLRELSSSEHEMTLLMTKERKVMGWDIDVFKKVFPKGTEATYREKVRLQRKYIEQGRKGDYAGLKKTTDEMSAQAMKILFSGEDGSPDPQLLSTTMPARVTSMLDTLSAVDKIKRKMPRRDFLLAGYKHLIDVSKAEEDPNYSLKDFNTGLESRKYVILIPKMLDEFLKY